MIEKTKRRNKGFITEEDISSLLQRYTATTVLALLQEVAQFEGAKIDWNALVKKTSTGISNVREYQMLWRHLAYQHGLLDKLDDVAEPLDDDSDLEYELGAFPEVSTEASTEAAACVKVLIASGLPSELGHPNNSTVEAPLTINIPNGRLSRATSENGATRSVNITVPVSVQKQPQPLVTTSEGLDANGTSGVNNSRKRKKWTADEDKKLSDAVAMHGESNWAAILRGGSIEDRTAQQLSQRWTFLKKKRLQTAASSSGGSRLGEELRAARHAMNLALDPPVRNAAANSSAGAILNGLSINSIPPSTSSESLPVQYQSQQRPTMMKSSSLGPLDSAAKPQVNLKSTSLRSNFASDPVRAAAVAAGARIASQSDAATLLKAAQAKNAIHIMPVGVSSVKTSLPGGKLSHLDSAPNVHFISAGLGTASSSAITAVSVGGSSHVLAKTHTSSTQYAAASSATHTAQRSSEHTLKEDAKVGRAVEVSRTDNEAKRQVQNGECPTVDGLSKQVQEGNAASISREAEQKSTVAENSNALPKVVSTSREAEQKSTAAESSNALPMVDVFEGDRVDVGSKVDGDIKNSKDSMITIMLDKKLEQPQVQVNENQSLIEPKSLKNTVADECGVPGKNQSDPIQPCKIVSTET